MSDSDAKSPLKIFISYSRKDSQFALDLLAGLQAAGFEPNLDVHDIAAGEVWESRLAGLIEAADTVVFIVSPDSVASERCAWEISKTASLQKRLLPVVYRPVVEGSVPVQLNALNYIFFDRPNSFGHALRTLASALRTDFSWVREHTRIGEAALRWVTRQRPETLLLRGEDLQQIKAWVKGQPQYAPEPTLLHLEFIAASEDAETARATTEAQRLEQMAAAQAEREKAFDREKSALLKADAALKEAQQALLKKQRGQIIIRGLLSVVILGLIGWINQDVVKQTLNWHLKMRPLMAQNFQPFVKTRAFTDALMPSQSFQDCAKDCPEMIIVPAGDFTMGSPKTEPDRGDDEGPQRLVSFKDRFAISKYPVTIEEWNTCVAVGGCPEVSDGGFTEARRPVVNVNWDEAQIYLSWLSLMTGKPYRLPSEAEWEYAARSSTQTMYTWGDVIGDKNANCIGCGSRWDNKSPSPVDAFAANAFGLHDVHGNVWQWVSDCYHETYVGAPTDGSAWMDACPQSRRSVRGGAWDSYAKSLRAANRDRISTGNRLNDLGFRVALPLDR